MSRRLDLEAKLRETEKALAMMHSALRDRPNAAPLLATARSLEKRLHRLQEKLHAEIATDSDEHPPAIGNYSGKPTTPDRTEKSPFLPVDSA